MKITAKPRMNPQQVKKKLTNNPSISNPIVRRIPGRLLFSANLLSFAAKSVR